MEPILRECLRCGQVRHQTGGRHVSEECPRCGYVGWAPSSALSEPVRRLLRERPPEVRRLRLV